MKKKTKVLKPHYFDKFKCIGSSCSDTCCRGWNISIDKDTFKIYKKNSNSELKDLFRKNINRQRNSEYNHNYGKIKLNEEGVCPFLDEDKLCKIHSKLGEKYLSQTCKTYPRKLNLVYGTLERSLEMSCPEVAKLCLLNTEIMEFDYNEEYLDINGMFLNYNLDENIENFNSLHEYFWDIRIFSIGLLQNRNFKLFERLVILGMVYKRIQQSISNENYIEISSIIDEFNKIIENDQSLIKENMNNLSNKIEVQIAIAKELMVGNISSNIVHQQYLKNLEDTMKGLGIKDSVNLESMNNIYKKGYEKYYKPYIKEKEYILENFLVNEFFGDVIPFSRYRDIWNSYIYICAIYTIIKIHLVGISLYRKELNDDIVIDVIQSFSRVSLHSREYVDFIVGFLKENKFDTLAYMTVMVKN